MRSLRSRLLVGMIGSIALLLLLFSILLYTTIRGALVDEFDSSLSVAAHALLASAKREHGTIELEIASDATTVPGTTDGTFFYQFSRDDGGALKRSASLQDSCLPAFHGEQDVFVFRFLTLDDGRKVRAAGIRAQSAIRREHEAEYRERGAEQELRRPERDNEETAQRQPLRERSSERKREERQREYERNEQDRRERRWREHEHDEYEADDGEAHEYEWDEREDDDRERKDDGKNESDEYGSPTRFAADTRQSGGDTACLNLVVARDCAGLVARLSLLRWLLFGAGTGTMAVGALVSFVILRRGLCPLDALAAQIAAVSDRDLALHVSRRQLPTEMIPVVDKLNDLLHRLGQTLSRERAFSGDVAHELRTPLAGICSTIEVAIATERSGPEYKEALSDCLAIAKRMHVVVENLLMLARLDAGQTALRRDKVHLTSIVDGCWQDVLDKAHQRGLTFENRLPSDFTGIGDGDSLELVFRNLLDNAVDYADERGRIWVAGQGVNGVVEVEVGNTGCQLDPKQASQVFERFWRADTSRKDTGVHAGLGLALVRRIVTSLDGDALVHVNGEQIFSVRITLPAK